MTHIFMRGNNKFEGTCGKIRGTWHYHVKQDRNYNMQVSTSLYTFRHLRTVPQTQVDSPPVSPVNAMVLHTLSNFSIRLVFSMPTRTPTPTPNPYPNLSSKTLEKANLEPSLKRSPDRNGVPGLIVHSWGAHVITGAPIRAKHACTVHADHLLMWFMSALILPIHVVSASTWKPKYYLLYVHN